MCVCKCECFCLSGSIIHPKAISAANARRKSHVDISICFHHLAFYQGLRISWLLTKCSFVVRINHLIWGRHTRTKFVLLGHPWCSPLTGFTLLANATYPRDNFHAAGLLSSLVTNQMASNIYARIYSYEPTIPIDR